MRGDAKKRFRNGSRRERATARSRPKIPLPFLSSGSTAREGHSRGRHQAPENPAAKRPHTLATSSPYPATAKTRSNTGTRGAARRLRSRQSFRLALRDECVVRQRRLRRAAGYGRKNSAIIAICVGSMRAGAWPIFGNSSSSARGPRWVISCATGVGRMSDFKPCSNRTEQRIRS